VYFNYSLFKPRGHYTKTDTAGRYFRAMMWLQHSFMCRKDATGMERAVMMAAILNSGKDATGKPLTTLYERVYQPIAFLIGSPDNLSIYDIASELKTNNVTSATQAMEPATMARIATAMNALAPTRNRIKPKIAVSCEDKINMMPQRYVFDNEIMQELVDVHPNAQRAFPRGLDVMAVLGSQTAEQILMNEYKDGAAWPAYARQLARLGLQFQQYTGWDDDVYSKWMQCLKALQLKYGNYPPLMQTDRWARKNLNTALASWAELKHDAILYAEQPMGAECGGGGPPKPITVGYVEPNTAFWKCMTELLTLTETMLKTYGMESEETTHITSRMKAEATFLLNASEKELRGEKLTSQEYETIEIIGSEVERLTLSVIEPGAYVDKWDDVKGAGKSVAVVADVYTRNISGCNKNGVLHEGVGLVNDLYAVVEIEGLLYLTKGATFSYYEFVQPLGTRLTDEEWQKMLEEPAKTPAVPDWMQPLLLPENEAPVNDDKVFYHTGC
jgi:hypothetical protein